jgi:hypothetical protein
MADWNGDDPAPESAAAFEKWLLDAAGSDGPPAEAAEAAWAQFAKTAGAVLPREPLQSGLAARNGATAAPSGASAAKWIGAGAVCGTILGGLLTAFVLRAGAQNQPGRSETLPVSTAETPAGGGSGASAPELEVPPRLALPAPRGDEGKDSDDDGVSRHGASSARLSPRAPHARVQRDTERRTRALPMPTTSGDAAGAASPRASSLEREVALLDAIRVANASGDFARALELVARYRSEFEDGELARDADVFEIEAFAGEGVPARVAQAARAFLSRYPGDPHTERVRALAAAGSR